jgi:hypothetical protein
MTSEAAGGKHGGIVAVMLARYEPLMPWPRNFLAVLIWDRQRYRRGGAMVLSDIKGDVLRVVCSACPRSERYSIRRLMRERGDARLTDLLAVLAADCPKREKFSMTDQCGARFGFADK